MAVTLLADAEIEAIDLLQNLRRGGHQVALKGGRMRVRGPALSTVQRDTLLRARERVVDFLHAEQALMTIATRVTTDPPGLSPEQERILFLARLERSLESFVIPLAIALPADVDVARLDAAFRRLVAGHRQLRLSIRFADDLTPVTYLRPANDFAVKVVSAADSASVRTAARAFAMRPIDPAQDPLIRADLVGGPDGAILTICIHHLVCDGWSARLIMRDLDRLYADPGADTVPAAEIEYEDFSAWQASLADSMVGAAQLAHWRGFARTAPEPVRLPRAKPRPLAPSFRSGRVQIPLARETMDALERVGGRRATLFARLTAAWGIFLARYCSCDRVGLGFPIAGRSRREVQQVVGLFSRMVAVAVDVDWQAGFCAHLERVAASLLVAQENQDVPIEVAARGMSRDAGLSPLFNVCINMLPQGSTAAAAVSALGGTRIDLGLPSVQLFDLTLVTWQEDGTLQLSFEYASDLFDDDAVTALSGYFAGFVAALVEAPESPVGSIPLLSPTERSVILAQGRGPTQPASGLLHDLVYAQTARRPDAVAAIAGEVLLSYGELCARADRLAAALMRRGVVADTPVGVLLHRGIDMVVAMLAVLRAGGAYLPIDPIYPADRRLFMLADAGVTLVVTEAALASVLPKGVTPVGVEATDAPIGEQPAPCPAAASSLAYIIYTSGSTGRPKGMMIEHQNIVSHTQWLNGMLALSPDDRVLHRTSASFDASVWEIFSTLAAGATIVLADPDAGNDPVAIGRVLATQRVSVMQCVPSLLDLLLVAGELREADGLRLICCGGEALPGGLVQRARAAHPARIVNLYGPTETTIDALAADVSDGPDPVPIGRPVANMQAIIVDPRGELCPPGVVGELLLAGLNVGRGYLGRPELTERAFAPHPAAPGTRVYRSGDLARWREDGQVDCLGRVDQQVKLRGFRIEPGEIEALLLGHPNIRGVAVRVRADAGGARLIAYLVAEGEAPAAERLRRRLKVRLPDHMVPSAYLFVERLPTLPNGKLDVAALPMPSRALAASAFVAPRTPLEARLAALLAEVLVLDTVGVTDSIFELGGDSLTAARYGARIAAMFGRKLPLGKLLAHPTVAELAGWMEETSPGATPFRITLAGSSDADTQILFMPTMLGHGSIYAGVASQLPRGMSALTCRLPGTEPGEHPLDDMTAIAAHCLDRLVAAGAARTVLVGWSFGGLVAFEVARQMTARGRPPSRLVLLDAYAPAEKGGGGLVSPALLQQMLRAQLGAEGLAAIDMAAVGRSYEASRTAALSHRGFAGVDPAIIIDVRAAESQGRVEAGELVPLVPAAAAVHQLAGGHFSILAAANRTQVAQLIAACLDGGGAGDA